MTRPAASHGGRATEAVARGFQAALKLATTEAAKRDLLIAAEFVRLQLHCVAPALGERFSASMEGEPPEGDGEGS